MLICDAFVGVRDKNVNVALYLRFVLLQAIDKKPPYSMQNISPQ